MNKKTRAALEGSILKWQAIVKGTGVDLGADNCPLCQMFKGCDGCPVMGRTGEPECRQTPYYAASDALSYDRFLGGPTAKSELAKRLAQKMLDFLISLRPKKMKTAPKKRSAA